MDVTCKYTCGCELCIYLQRHIDIVEHTCWDVLNENFGFGSLPVESVPVVEVFAIDTYDVSTWNLLTSSQVHM